MTTKHKQKIMINKTELLKIFFPKEIDWERYELIKVNEIDDTSLSPYIWRLEFILQEKNIVPQWLRPHWERIISKWFYPPKSITDFPVRDRLARLILIKRRWMNKATKEYIQSNFELNYSWTKTTFTLD